MRKYTQNMRVTFHSITHIAEEKKTFNAWKIVTKNARIYRLDRVTVNIYINAV